MNLEEIFFEKICPIFGTIIVIQLIILLSIFIFGVTGILCW